MTVLSDSHKNITPPSNQILVRFNYKYVKQHETLLLPGGENEGWDGSFYA